MINRITGLIYQVVQFRYSYIPIKEIHVAVTWPENAEIILDPHSQIERLKSHFIENNPGIEDQGKIDIYFKADQYSATS